MDFYHTHISKKAFDLVQDVLKSSFVSEGEIVKSFEAKLTNNLGLVNPVAVNSGTSALHLGLAVAGVGPGDEVILPAQTFVATGLAILMQGAVPVFADIQYDTGNIDPKSIKEKVTPKTKAVIPVHWAGYPCDMDEINAIAKEHDIAVVEDSAHALGATYKGKPIGSISRFSAFSFQAIKHLTTGDGGALCCLNEIDYKSSRKRRWFGIDREGSSPSLLGERVFDINDIGYKYHMNNVSAAIGLGNLEDFAERLARRREIAKIYRDELSDLEGVQLLNYGAEGESAYWLFTLLVEKRPEFIRKLKEFGVPTSVVHQGIDRFSVFGGVREDLENQIRFNKDQISIPIHEGMTDGEIKQVTGAVWSG